jgi:hypothetical protein
MSVVIRATGYRGFLPVLLLYSLAKLRIQLEANETDIISLMPR